MTHPPQRNLGLDLVRATEAAALAAGRWMGLGKPDEADNDATEAMFKTLNTLDMEGHIVIGEEGSWAGIRRWTAVHWSVRATAPRSTWSSTQSMAANAWRWAIPDMAVVGRGAARRDVVRRGRSVHGQDRRRSQRGQGHGARMHACAGGLDLGAGGAPEG